MKKLLILVGILFVGLLTACNGSESNDDGVTVVRVGVVGAFQQQWDVVNENLAPYNIYVELVPFSDFTTPNTVLAAGETDLNAFQNIGFLNNAIENNGYEITPIGVTFVAPLNVFANFDRISSIADLGEGDEVGIPSDLTNGGRALKVLEAAGLIVMDPAVGFLGTEADIIENPSGIIIRPAESATLPSMLPDLAAAVINSQNARTGGLDLVADSIFLEDSLNLEIADHLVNVIVARTDEADNEIFARIVEAFQTAEVARIMEAEFGGIAAFDYEN